MKTNVTFFRRLSQRTKSFTKATVAALLLALAYFAFPSLIGRALIMYSSYDLPLQSTFFPRGSPLFKLASKHDLGTSLSRAIGVRQNSFAKVLLAEGAPIDRPHDSTSLSPLNSAITSGNIEMVEMLLNAGADVNEYKHEIIYPLGLAALGNRIQIFHLLIKKGANLDRLRTRREEILRVTRSQGYHEITEFLEQLPSIKKSGGDVSLNDVRAPATKQVASQTADQVGAR